MDIGLHNRNCYESMTDYTTPKYSKGDEVEVTEYMASIRGVIVGIQHLRGDWLYSVKHGGEVHYYSEKQLRQ